MNVAPPINVVFDFGMVLVDFNPNYLYAGLIKDEARRQMFLTQICTNEWHERHDTGITFAENAAPLLQKYTSDPEICGWIKAWGPRFGEMLKPIDGTIAILEQLHRAKVPLYGLTNWAAESFPPAYRRFAFMSLFKDIVVSGIEGKVKPDPALYDLLIKRTGIDPKKSVYIDDREKNLLPAQKLGFTCIRFTTPEALADNLRHLGFLQQPAPGMKAVP